MSGLGPPDARGGTQGTRESEQTDAHAGACAAGWLCGAHPARMNQVEFVPGTCACARLLATLNCFQQCARAMV